jgi:uncharacterized membrane protein YfcA
LEIQTHTYLLATLIILGAYFIRGISGFGSGLISVPLLAHLLPLTFVVPLILITDFIASLLLGIHVRQHARWEEIRPLLPFGFIGVVAGATLLVNVPRTPLLIALGILVLIFGVRNILNLHGFRIIPRLWAVPTGLIGGTISGLFGTGGPPYVIYLSHRLYKPAELRATFTGLFLLEGSWRIVTFIVAGLFHDIALVTTTLAAVPLVMLGLWMGNHVHVGLTATQMQRILGSLLLVSGGSLLWRALVN